jgi:hypothetical protein
VLTPLRALLLGSTILLLATGLTTARESSAGSIKGTVVLKGTAPELKKLAVTIDQYVCGKEKNSEELVVSPQGGIRSAVVWIEKPRRRRPRSPCPPPRPWTRRNARSCPAWSSFRPAGRSIS